MRYQLPSPQKTGKTAGFCILIFICLNRAGKTGDSEPNGFELFLNFC
jgi:hypothetical protein